MPILALPFIIVISLVVAYYYKKGAFDKIVEGSNLSTDVSMNTYLQSVFLRDCDSHGCGHFGAPRGDRTHQGLDIRSDPLAPFPVPFDCEIIRYGVVDNQSPTYHLIEIKGTQGQFKNWKCKLMYLNKGNSFIGQRISKFTPIGLTETLSLRYGSQMTNHIHLELRTPSGILVDPEQYL